MKYFKYLAVVLALAISIGGVIPGAIVHAETDATVEAMTSFEVSGQLIELSSTSAPTTIVVRKNPTGEFTDYVVEITQATTFGEGTAKTSMDDWITGDAVRVVGTRNENTGVVTATRVVNTSLNLKNDRGFNGWVTAIDTANHTLTVQWNNVNTVFSITNKTHLVVGSTNPASLSDFKVGDRIRARLVNGSTTNEARIVLVLRRGEDLFLKARTRAFSATVNEIQNGKLSVTLGANAHLRHGDVNNLVGNEGDKKTVSYDENTVFVRRYNGRTSIDEFVEGDTIFVVGRVNDDGTISATLIKDVNIWRKDIVRTEGEVLSIDTKTNTLTVSWPTSCSGDGAVATIHYEDETRFSEKGEHGDESTLEVGDAIHVRGTRHGEACDDTFTIDHVTEIGVRPDRHGSDQEEVDGEDEASEPEDLPEEEDHKTTEEEHRGSSSDQEDDATDDSLSGEEDTHAEDQTEESEQDSSGEDHHEGGRH